MKNTMLAGITINGKSYNLATFGISTGSYFTTSTNEKGVFHIDGDEDDSTTKEIQINCVRQLQMIRIR